MGDFFSFFFGLCFLAFLAHFCFALFVVLLLLLFFFVLFYFLPLHIQFLIFFLTIKRRKKKQKIGLSAYSMQQKRVHILMRAALSKTIFLFLALWDTLVGHFNLKSDFPKLTQSRLWPN